MTPKLSYFLTTYNKLPYLREVMAHLEKEKREDEELVVADGGSDDGTREFVAGLHARGVVDRFVSEPDFGEGHGDNKCLLMARGEILKLITDDDAFDWKGIQRCKEYMLDNHEIDALGTNGISFSATRKDTVRDADFEDEFSEYQRTGRGFGFCGLGLMMRRTSLPLLGLFDPNFTRMDAEYTLRITSGKTRLAWFTGRAWARILNPQSVSKNRARLQITENRRLAGMYPATNITSESSPLRRLRRFRGDLMKFIRRTVGRRRPTDVAPPVDIANWMEQAYSALNRRNGSNPGKFLK